MEAKRRKLDSGQADEATKKSLLVSEEFIEAIKSSNLDRVISDLLKLKKHLTTKARVLELLEKDRPTFRAIISFVVNQGSAKFSRKANKCQSSENQQQINSVLREAFSLLANACHLSVLACVEIRSKDLGLSPLYVRFLEANTTLVPISLKAALLRLLGNLCELKETALLIALNRQLVERIALCLELDDKKVVDQALRIIRYLAKRPQLAKSVIRSEACFHLAKYIVPRNVNGEIFEINSEMLKIFHFLSKYHASSMGRHFANSTEFVEQCLSLLLKFPSIEEPSLYCKYWIGIIMGCIESSFEMRTVLGNSAISKVLELEANKNELCDLHCRFLCAFTQDVHKLTWLHESSGMSKILDKLKIIDDNGSNENEKLTQLRIQECIFESFRFTTYSETIGFIVQVAFF